MSGNSIILVPFEFHSGGELDNLCDWLAPKFQAEVEIFSMPLDSNMFYDKGRNQYYSSALIKHLNVLRPKWARKILAISKLDLFIPILTFVFGEAQLKGPCAVVSSFRLENEYYGLPQDKFLLRERLLKECVHELGHTYGLVHCHNPECVMKSSTYVEEIDLKNADFCPTCQNLVDEGIRAKDK